MGNGEGMGANAEGGHAEGPDAVTRLAGREVVFADSSFRRGGNL